MKYIYKTRYITVIVCLLLLSTTSCENFLEAPLPPEKITTDKVFGTAGTIEMTMLGVYSKATNYYGGGQFVYRADQLADNLSANPPLASDIISTAQYDASNSESLSSSWTAPYATIYEVNTMLQNLPTATAKLTDEQRGRYIAQNLFLRALMYFELVRLYGDVPLILEPDPTVSKSKARAPKAEVYAAIVADLKDAMSKLPGTNITGLDARRCANKYVAEALLARVYLFMGDYANAETAATDVINSGNYSLGTDLSAVLMRRSKEIIFATDGSMIDAPNSCWYYGLYGMPNFYQEFPEAYAWEYSGWGCLTQSAIDEYEPNDQRFEKWFTYSAEENVFSIKYPYSFFFQELADADPQDFCVLRLSEMYLIRSEAKARKSAPDLAGAAQDLNLIRTKHGALPKLTASSQAELLTALEHENRVEFMCEGHRWYDLVRTNRADAVLSKLSTKSGWKANKILLPIPTKELINNKNLVQNTGY